MGGVHLPGGPAYCPGLDGPQKDHLLLWGESGFEAIHERFLLWCECTRRKKKPSIRTASFGRIMARDLFGMLAHASDGSSPPKAPQLSVLGCRTLSGHS